MINWSQAFIAQASSDLDAYQFLAERSTLPVCHRLHYLQMWLEKLCKGYLYVGEAAAYERMLRDRHNVIAKILPHLISEARQR